MGSAAANGREEHPEGRALPAGGAGDPQVRPNGSSTMPWTVASPRVPRDFGREERIEDCSRTPPGRIPGPVSATSRARRSARPQRLALEVGPGRPRSGPWFPTRCAGSPAPPSGPTASRPLTIRRQDQLLTSRLSPSMKARPRPAPSGRATAGGGRGPKRAQQTSTRRFRSSAGTGVWPALMQARTGRPGPSARAEESSSRAHEVVHGAQFQGGAVPRCPDGALRMSLKSRAIPPAISRSDSSPAMLEMGLFDLPRGLTLVAMTPDTSRGTGPGHR